MELARLEPRRSTRKRTQTKAFEIDTITPAPKRVKTSKHPEPAELGTTSDDVIAPSVQLNSQVDAQLDEPVDAPLPEQRKFDKIVPEELPYGCTPPSPFEGNVTLDWYQVVSLPPIYLSQFLTDTTRNIHTFRGSQRYIVCNIKNLCSSIVILVLHYSVKSWSATLTLENKLLVYTCM